MMLAITGLPSILQRASRQEGAGYAQEQLSQSMWSPEITSSYTPPPVAGSNTDSILLSPESMDPNRPYTFQFLDHWMFALTDGRGGLAVYYLPNPSL